MATTPLQSLKVLNGGDGTVMDRKNLGHVATSPASISGKGEGVGHRSSACCRQNPFLIESDSYLQKVGRGVKLFTPRASTAASVTTQSTESPKGLHWLPPAIDSGTPMIPCPLYNRNRSPLLPREDTQL